MEFLKKYRKHIGLALGVLLLMGASYFAVKLYWRSRGPARMRDLMAKMSNPDLNQDQRRDLFNKMREEGQNLSDSQRGQMGKERTQQMLAPINKYFQLSDSEKAAYLDEQIDKEEEMMKRIKEWREKRAQEGDQGGGGNRPGRGRNNGGGDNQGGGGGNQGGGNQGGGDSNVPPPPPNQGGGGQGGGGGPPPPGSDNQGGGGPARNAGGQGDRSQRRKQSLDYSSPQDRQNWSQYSQDYQNRRQQRGLGPSSFGGFGGGGFGGGRRGG